MSIYRLTGVAEVVDTREGVSKGPEPKPYSIPFINVRVDRFVMTTANVPDGLFDALKGHVGAVVDLVCDVTASGGYLRSQVMDFWPDDEAASSASHSFGGLAPAV